MAEVEEFNTVRPNWRIFRFLNGMSFFPNQLTYLPAHGFVILSWYLFCQDVAKYLFQTFPLNYSPGQD